MITYYVVQSWQEGRKGVLIPDDAMEAPSEYAALSRARMLAMGKPAVIAFSRTGDPDLGVWEDAVILCQHGIVPVEELMEMSA